MHAMDTYFALINIIFKEYDKLLCNVLIVRFIRNCYDIIGREYYQVSHLKYLFFLIVI